MITASLKFNEVMEARGMSVRQLSDILGLTGRTDLHRFKNGEHDNFTLITLSRLCVGLGVTDLHEIIEFTGVKKRPPEPGYICSIELNLANVLDRKKGITVQMIADRLKKTKSYISEIKNTRPNVKLDLLLAIANVVGVEYIEDLLTIRRLPKISAYDKTKLCTRFGNLWLLETRSVKTSGGNPTRQGLCRCKCGTVKWISLGALVRGQSCCDRGCKYNPTNRNHNLYIGKKYGVLTIRGIHYNHQQKTIAECECDCGNHTDIDLVKVLRGQKACSRECKFYKRGVSDGLNDLKGAKFGHLTVQDVYRTTTDTERDVTMARCQCDCGSVKEFEVGRLKAGQKYCGTDCTYYDSGWTTPPSNYVEGTDLTAITSKPSKANKSGVVGVYWDARMECWQANITFKNKTIKLGAFKDKQDAIAARYRAEERYFKPILEKYGVKKENDENEKNM